MSGLARKLRGQQSAHTSERAESAHGAAQLRRIAERPECPCGGADTLGHILRMQADFQNRGAQIAGIESNRVELQAEVGPQPVEVGRIRTNVGPRCAKVGPTSTNGGVKSNDPR